MAVPIHKVLFQVSLFAFLAFVLGVGQTANATILASESFDYPGTGSIAGLSGGVGWGANAWAVQRESATLATGLTFSDYVVAGKSVLLTDNNTSNNNGAIASRQIGTGITAGNTLWLSLLWQHGATAFNAYWSQSGMHKGTTPTTAEQMYLAIRPGNAKDPYTSDYSWFDLASTANWNNTYNGAVYLIVGKVTNVGGGGSQTVKLWVLNAANYDAIKAGGITEAELDATYTARGSSAAASGNVWNVGDYIHLFSAHSTNNPVLSTFDEIKYATTLTEVVPEPATMALLGIGAVAMLAKRRRK